MKIVLCCDKFLYHTLYKAFPKYDAHGNIIGSLFSEDEYDNYLIRDKRYINITLNPLDGIKDIYMILIQKQWYSDKRCINIAKFVKQLHPEAKLVYLFKDENVEEHQYFCHRLVNEELAFIATDIDELRTIIENRFELKQENYLLNNVPKSKFNKQKKLFLKGT